MLSKAFVTDSSVYNYPFLAQKELINTKVVHILKVYVGYILVKYLSSYIQNIIVVSMEQAV